MLFLPCTKWLKQTWAMKFWQEVSKAIGNSLFDDIREKIATVMGNISAEATMLASFEFLLVDSDQAPETEKIRWAKYPQWFSSLSWTSTFSWGSMTRARKSDNVKDPSYKPLAVTLCKRWTQEKLWTIKNKIMPYMYIDRINEAISKR